jgi:hypothetical protein
MTLTPTERKQKELELLEIEIELGEAEFAQAQAQAQAQEPDPNAGLAEEYEDLSWLEKAPTTLGTSLRKTAGSVANLLGGGDFDKDNFNLSELALSGMSPQGMALLQQRDPDFDPLKTETISDDPDLNIPLTQKGFDELEARYAAKDLDQGGLRTAGDIGAALMAGGPAVKGVGALIQGGAKLGPKGLQQAVQYFSRNSTKPRFWRSVPRLAGAGAIYGGVGAEPDSRGMSAGFGTAANTLMPGAGQLLSRGAVKLDPYAQQVVNKTKEWMPLNLSLSGGGLEGLTRTIYQQFIRTMPGATQWLKMQANRGIDATLKSGVYREALPRSAWKEWAPKIMGKPSGLLRGPTDQRAAREVMKDFWDNAYKTIDAYKINFNDLRFGKLGEASFSRIFGALEAGPAKKAMQNVTAHLKEALTKNGTVGALTAAKREILELYPKLDARALGKFIDEQIKGATKAAGQKGADDFAYYQSLAKPYVNWSTIKEAGAAATGKSELGRITPAELLAATTAKGKGDTYAGSQGQGLMQRGLEKANRGIFKENVNAPYPSGFLTLATLGMGTQLAGGPGAAAVIAVLVGAGLLSSKMAQKAISGNAAAQKIVQDLVKKHPQLFAQQLPSKAVSTQAAAISGANE